MIFILLIRILFLLSFVQRSKQNMCLSSIMPIKHMFLQKLLQN